MTKNANYRKINDGSLNSSTLHKKDSKQDSVRAILKRDTEKEVFNSLSGWADIIVKD